MKQGTLLFVLSAIGLLLTAMPVSAGQVYGTVTDAKGPVKRVLVVIECPNNLSGRASTDQYGSYSVYVNANGKCSIVVNGIGPLPIRVYDDEVRYDLRIDGNSLRRK